MRRVYHHFPDASISPLLDVEPLEFSLGPLLHSLIPQIEECLLVLGTQLLVLHVLPHLLKGELSKRVLEAKCLRRVFLEKEPIGRRSVWGECF